jgi:hypothetical protein
MDCRRLLVYECPPIDRYAFVAPVHCLHPHSAVLPFYFDTSSTADAFLLQCGMTAFFATRFPAREGRFEFRLFFSFFVSVSFVGRPL